MLSLRTNRGARLCDGFSRREILRAGGIGLFGGGLTLSSLLTPTPAPARSLATQPGFGRARSCIVLFLMGGPPQHSTWDPKPDAPENVRGAYGPIATSVPGVQFCELLPHTARVADRLCVLRAVSTGDNAHSSSGYYMLTGRPHAPKNFENANPGPPNDAPSIGALMGRLLGPSGELPTAVTLPGRIFNTDGSIWPGQDAGFLGRAANPWLLNATPSDSGLSVGEISLPAELGPDRVAARRNLLEHLGRSLDFASAQPLGHAFDSNTRQAFDLLGSPRARNAFQIEKESDSTQDRYGRTPFGQGVLMSRRLVEAGVRLVQVNWYRGPDEPTMNPVWDTHIDETNRLKQVLAPPMDLAFSALVEDLDCRGLLDETLVVCMAEFGRSPRLDANQGRNHWGSVFSVAMAGGGLQGGVVHGSSDKIGAYPREGLVRPEDLTATIAFALGIDPAAEYQDPLGRLHFASRGQVLNMLF